MKTRVQVFNGFLVLLVIASLTGCRTPEERQRRRQLSNVRVHVESDSQTDQSSAITVLRSLPTRLNVNREPLLDEHNVVGAFVEDQPGGYVVRIKFDRQGSWILEHATVVNRNRHLAIHAFFGENRWLAAPLITGKNSTGALTFTPDCSREEAERFVRGLNNVARKLNRKENWPFRGPVDK